MRQTSSSHGEHNFDSLNSLQLPQFLSSIDKKNTSNCSEQDSDRAIGISKSDLLAFAREVSKSDRIVLHESPSSAKNIVSKLKRQGFKTESPIEVINAVALDNSNYAKVLIATIIPVNLPAPHNKTLPFVSIHEGNSEEGKIFRSKIYQTISDTHGLNLPNYFKNKFSEIENHRLSRRKWLTGVGASLATGGIAYASFPYAVSAYKAYNQYALDKARKVAVSDSIELYKASELVKVDPSRISDILAPITGRKYASLVMAVCDPEITVTLNGDTLSNQTLITVLKDLAIAETQSNREITGMADGTEAGFDALFLQIIKFSNNREDVIAAAEAVSEISKSSKK